MFRVLSFCLLAIAWLLPWQASSAQIERWVDASGRVHYGDQPPAQVDASKVPIHPNVIESGPPAEWAWSRDLSVVAAAQEEAVPRSAFDEYVELCRRNRGVDCELEAQQMIQGPAPVRFPCDPAIFPRPDLKPPPAPPQERHPMPRR
jgi:hypothetical protein